MLTQQYDSTSCWVRRDEYTADRKYYQVDLGLVEIPINIPQDAEEVNLSHNQINMIKAHTFVRLLQCTKLDLDSNMISEVENGGFNGLSAVTDLDIGNNRLQFLYLNTFSDMKNCKMLHLLVFISLYHNNLRTLKAGTFQGLVAVKYLWINKNKINSIEDNTFSKLKELVSLQLSGNDLETLNQGMFYGLSSLRVLYLEGNDLKHLPVDVFTHLPRPLKLELHKDRQNLRKDNPFQCDADLGWLRQEELQGTITWYSRFSPHKLRCANRIDWDSWDCDLTLQHSRGRYISGE